MKSPALLFSLVSKPVILLCNSIVGGGRSVPRLLLIVTERVSLWNSGVQYWKTHLSRVKIHIP